MKQTPFHTIKDEDIPNLLVGAEMLTEVDNYNENGMTNIPVFRLWHDYKGKLDGRRWKGAKVVVHVILGKDSESFFLFILQNKHREELKIAFPAGSFATLIPLLLMTKELRFTTFQRDLSTKGAREKNIIKVKLQGESLQTYKYGAMLFMDMAGMLNHPESQVIKKEENEEARA